MCGISGIINFNNTPIDIGVLTAMTDAQIHRGPDDQGRTVFSLSKVNFRHLNKDQQNGLIPFECGLGFNRLSIIDPSLLGHQPMTSVDEKVIIAFNGEIYNANELREELKNRGLVFRSTTDTEVILNLYITYGQEGMLKRLNGMYAICIVDLYKQRVTLSRDRFGIKPLYICKLTNKILFASESKSFLYHPEFNIKINKPSLDEYLIFRYCAESAHLIDNVEQLTPGHWLEIYSDGKIKTHKYWSIPNREIRNKKTNKELIAEADDVLNRVVKRQLVSDVDIGCQLSGGVDSSLVNIFAAKNASSSMESFSVIFDDPRFSEEPWIDIAANKANVASYRYRMSSAYFSDNIKKASWHLDQPLNHPNSLGLMFLAENSSAHVKVMLSGEGADEVLGGYSRYYYALLRPMIRDTISILQDISPRFPVRLAERLGGKDDKENHFIKSSSFVSQDQLNKINPDSNYKQALLKRRDIFNENISEDHVTNCLKYDMRTYLVDLLMRQDKMTMSASVENRVPFLDNEWINFVFNNASTSNLVSLFSGYNPKKWMTKGTKVFLKKLALKYFKDDFVFRQKAGFAVPLSDYFQSPTFVETINDEVLPGLQSRGLIDAEYIKLLWNQVGTSKEDNLESLWVSLSLEIWLQELENKSKEANVCNYVV